MFDCSSPEATKCFCSHAFARRVEQASARRGTEANSRWAEIDRMVVGLAPDVPLVNARALASKRAGNLQDRP